MPARYVASPASTDEASALLRAAAGLSLTIVARGGGRRQHWGNPPASCDLIVDTQKLDKVIEHAAGDLIVTAQAGVRLPDLQKLTAAAGQHLAIGPRTSAEGGTVGGLIATNAADSWRYRYGAPRDLLIGITVVLADGTVARSGGKVVKNVAGYDLGKLFAGSYGTLGLITEATFRLHPKPVTAIWLSVNCPDPEAAAKTVRAMADAPLAPSALDLYWPAAKDPLSVSVLLEGDEPSVNHRLDRMRECLDRELAGVEPTVGPFSPARPPADDRELAEAGGASIRVAFWVGQLARVLNLIRTAAVANELDPAIEGSAGAGVLHVAVPADAAADAVARFVTELRAGLASLSEGTVLPSTASAVVVYAPPDVRNAVDLWGPVPSPGLMRAVK
ncbi:MAG: FAD-binding oxidoreductase, partial [Actinobacteria bacterium]|nr:FAD-binding oxidoreductase [Actinomycetota bacterium]